ncbi:unnamed protein product [Euphydryas editha]|uniref:SLED domain-containing protein n=1 Tax=Euphydryas editha TaxID=104508 RepID=A0AAU9UW37_EUPED|nr:unnamed protein product [Euphydryas editha]
MMEFDWNNYLEDTKCVAVPDELFSHPTPTLEAHSFAMGMKVEALSPDMKTFCPATVTKIFNDLQFLVEIDDYIDDYEDSKMAWMCDNMHPYIYPIGWAQRNKLEIKPPKIWKEGPFDWDEYLSMTASVPAPEYCFGNKDLLKGLQVNMKLEAANPLNREEIHVANVESIVEHMLYVELIPIGEKYWFSQNSDLLFPVGWCESISYELHIPDTNPKDPPKPVEEPRTIREEFKSSKEWCDKIFFNYKCYAGPSINRIKLSHLPKHVGPGPLLLVMKDVLNKIISTSHTPAKLLKDWETEALPEKGMKLDMLRAKLKNKRYHAYVPIVTTSEQVESFCRDMCVKLQACPTLFGPVEYPDQCPQNCQQVKKSTFHNGTERRRRPKFRLTFKKIKKKVSEKREKEQRLQEIENNRGGESNESEHSAGSEPGPRPGLLGTRPGSTGTRPGSPGARSGSPGTRPGSPSTRPDSLSSPALPGSSSNCAWVTKKKREIKSTYPKKEIKTRGTKRPNFAVQMKEAHWNKKYVETIYSNSCANKKQHAESHTENETNARSCNSRYTKNISDVSAGEEPKVKKEKNCTNDPLPSNSKMIENDTAMTWIKGKEKLARNPWNWSVDDVYQYLRSTEDCKLIADKIKQEEIDGQAFIMLDLPTITHFLHMKKEFAKQLCRHITMVRWYYIVNFEENGET